VFFYTIYNMSKLNQHKFNILIGNTIRDFRKKSNFSRLELATKSNVNEKYLGKIERGESSASVFILKKIAIGLEVELIKLLKKA
jgi:transcriptional regulator with XRE-family HTH domain